MTFEEKYGCFTAYQNETARKALEFNKGELHTLEVALKFGNDYAVRTNLPYSEIENRYNKLKELVAYLEKLLKSNGEIVNPIYKAYWNSLKDKEV
jgi:hypothetical protein